MAVELLAAGAEGRLSLQPGQSARGGKVDPEHAPLPRYPDGWLAERLDEVRVEARLSIDANGAAGLPDLAVLAPDPKCTDACQQAFAGEVRAVLADWRFLPLEVLDWVDRPDEDGDGEPDGVRREVVAVQPYSLRFGFRFTQVDGLPQVGLSSSPP